jgi:hypothetical protein
MNFVVVSVDSADSGLCILHALFEMEIYPQGLPGIDAALTIEEGARIQARIDGEFEAWIRSNPIARRLAQVCHQEDVGRPRKAAGPISPTSLSGAS